MRAFELLQSIEKMGIEVIAGVPDSTLKPFCDGLQLYEGHFRHYVTANEGAAVGLGVGTYLASGKPACIYMQNSGIGNAVNPLASLANGDVYGIPMLFIVGWRGEPGVKDEPQHVFQGKITCGLLDIMEISYAIVDAHTTGEEMLAILNQAAEHLAQQRQFAVVVKKGTFETDRKFTWTNGNTLIRENVLRRILEMMPREACVVSTTGKISRELYEQSNQLFGSHDSIFMTVGGMGHASMIAFGIAEERPDKKVICIDGDGAVLMHMGALAFIASRAPANYIHIVLNNQAHESVGAMPTDCRKTDLSALARAAGYAYVERITDDRGLCGLKEAMESRRGPMFYEILVSLDSRADLLRPAETAKENRDGFMRAIGSGTDDSLLTF